MLLLASPLFLHLTHGVRSTTAAHIQQSPNTSLKTSHIYSSNPASKLTSDDEAALQQILNRKLTGVPTAIVQNKTLTLAQMLSAPDSVLPFPPYVYSVNPYVPMDARR